MDEYWVHYNPIEPGGRPKFSVFQVGEGRHRIVSPPGRLAAPAEVVNLLREQGVDARGAERAIQEATRQGIGKVVVAEDRGSRMGDRN